jgi:hypothetical protein
VQDWRPFGPTQLRAGESYRVVRAGFDAGQTAGTFGQESRLVDRSGWAQDGHNATFDGAVLITFNALEEAEEIKVRLWQRCRCLCDLFVISASGLLLWPKLREELASAQLVIARTHRSPRLGID